jgi:hypothetical protein
MPTNKTTQRPCADCKVIIDYIPRRVRCVECYKKKLNENQPKIKFIQDDEDDYDETDGISLK